MNRGEIWMYRFKAPDTRRPVLVLARQDAIDLLHTVIVAPIRSTIYGVPSEVLVGTDQGLKHASAISLDNLQSVERSRLVAYVATLPPSKMRAVCRALAIATGCD